MTTAVDSPATTNMADEEDAQPEVLQPCAVCGRKFNPRSLDKHVKICERTAAKKRKPFDSAKQRIQGTELAEFLPKQQQQQQHHEPAAAAGAKEPARAAHHHHRAAPGGEHDSRARKKNQAWKQTRDEFLRAIRAARGDVPAPSQSQQHSSSSAASSAPNQQQQQQQQQHGNGPSSSQAPQQRPSTLSLVTAPGAPQRSNEKGTCPTCQRQFGVKSYDRHIAFCKERATRLPASPQTSNNVAKERLEARMKYRAPALKNRKPTNREKYSPGGGQKALLASPLLGKGPAARDMSASVSHKNPDTASPKLPMLKRPGQTNKESPTASSGPLKSRPMDRSNRTPEPQDSLNPPALRQLFASRRLLMLSEVLPSKILQSKPSVSSSSSQKSSARLASSYLKKELAEAPVEVPVERSERKPKKKIKVKSRTRKVEVEEAKVEITENYAEAELEAESFEMNTENYELETEPSANFVTWKQIREDVSRNNEMESIDKEEEPILSDVTGLSSLDEGNSTTDEFEYNERMVCHSGRKYVSPENTKEKVYVASYSGNEQTLTSRCGDISGLAMNETYTIDDAIRQQSLSLTNKDSLNTIDSDEKNNAANRDSDDDGGLSSASTKTFRKSDRQIRVIDFVDSLDMRNSERKNDDSESDEEKTVTEEPRLTLHSCETPKNDGVDENTHNEPSVHSRKIKDRLLSRPKKCLSMSNITDAKDNNNSRENRSFAKNMKKVEEDVDRSAVNDRAKLDAQESDPNPAHTEKPSSSSGRRCATYVIDDDSPTPRCIRQQSGADESSEEKPQKKRRKLQRVSGDEDGPSSKNESLEWQGSKNSPAENSEVQQQQSSLVMLDYYRNEAATFSDVSSVRTDEHQLIEFDLSDEDYADENESNASELLKEIDVGLVGSQNAQEAYVCFAAGEDALVDLTSKMRAIDLAACRPRTDVRTRRRRSARNGSFDEETSISTIELTDFSKPAQQHYEKEICTITRLDAIGRDDKFLPSIGARPHDWKARMEYHREKLVKSKSKLRHGIIDVDAKPAAASAADEERPRYPKSRLCPTMRRILHMDRQSLLRRSFERLPRCDWNSYIRRHPDFSMILRGRIGMGKDYNPFLLAEQQLNDLFSDTSDQSSTDGSAICPPQKPNSSPAFPLSHSSAFVKYPNSANPQLPSQSQQQSSSEPKQPQRISLIAPPTGFDDLTSSDLSSDCTETISLSRELLTSSSLGSRSHQLEGRELGRRLIIDQSQALGGGEFAPTIDQQQQSKLNGSNGLGSRLARPLASRSNSMRSASAPKPPERKISSSSSSGSSDFSRPLKPSNSGSNEPASQQQQQQRANNYKNGLNGSNLSLTSIISSTDLEMKRSNSLFDELLSSFEDDVNSTSTLPSLMSLMRNDHSVSILSSTPQQNGCQQRPMPNGRINCSDDDAELSSPESVKRQECGGKLSADSAYSSLNRKYSTHNGRSANDVSNDSHNRFKLSKFCHECGFKFPDSAKFCCECGVKRLTL